MFNVFRALHSSGFGLQVQGDSGTKLLGVLAAKAVSSSDGPHSQDAGAQQKSKLKAA